MSCDVIRKGGPTRSRYILRQYRATGLADLIRSRPGHHHQLVSKPYGGQGAKCKSMRIFVGLAISLSHTLAQQRQHGREPGHLIKDKGKDIFLLTGTPVFCIHTHWCISIFSFRSICFFRFLSITVDRFRMLPVPTRQSAVLELLEISKCGYGKLAPSVWTFLENENHSYFDRPSWLMHG